MLKIYNIMYNNEIKVGEIRDRDGHLTAYLTNKLEGKYPRKLFGIVNTKFEVDNKKVRYWIDCRVAPKSQACMGDILKFHGLKKYDQWELCKKLKGRTINDPFWVVEQHE